MYVPQLPSPRHFVIYFLSKVYQKPNYNLLMRELNIAIIVACIASFRQLFVTDQNQHQYRGRGRFFTGTTHRNLLYYFRSPRGKSTSNLSGSHIERAPIISIKGRSSWDKSNGKTEPVPLDGIHVSQDISISSTTSV